MSRRESVLRNPREPWKWGKSKRSEHFLRLKAGRPFHSVPVVESKTGLACVSRSQDAYIIVTSAGATYVPADVLCVLSCWDQTLSRVVDNNEVERGRKKERKERRKERRVMKMSRESDHASRLGKLVDSSSFERTTKRLLRLRKN